MQSPQNKPQEQRPEQSRDTNNTTTNNNETRPGTPPPPPYSPVTPVFAQLAPVQNGNHPIVPPPIPSSSSSMSPTAAAAAATPSQPLPSQNAQQPASSGPGTGTRTEFATEPPPPVPIGPISESDNPDVIALRSAISILQLQKQQSLRDIRALDRMKRAAVADPERFARELTAGNLAAEDRGGFINFSEENEDEDDERGEQEGEGEDENDAFSNLGRFPAPQNVVRMPPINWAKYQIVGEPLDKMHAEQLRRPSAGEPQPTQRAPEHVLASPYRPLVDKLETPGRAAGASRGKK